ncbi:hypothetical protein Bca52824_016352 [Brassica carinata]|uniref:DUF4283 domain-containing protein n=1 Tax=Brassica carinata TaxID=52824 RepID=A0A8X8B403_BRACI|nr:hypothetical protein Bca52824_016352 [Brassica carinata]
MNFWHIADIPIVLREWSSKTASAQPDLTAVPLWIDLKGVPDHLFSQNGLTFFGDTIGRTVKLHPSTERCVRLDVARLLVVMNLEEPLPECISVRGSGERIAVSYPWLPPRCHGCQKWGHNDKNCSKNKLNKEIQDAEHSGKAQEKNGGSVGLEDTIINNQKSIDIADPVLEVANMSTEQVIAPHISTEGSEDKQSASKDVGMGIASTQVGQDKAVESAENTEWMTKPSSKYHKGVRHLRQWERARKLTPHPPDSTCLALS